MNKTTYNEFIQKATSGTMPDDENPAFVFAMTHRFLLLQIAKGEIDPVALARLELANRGYDQNGDWVGFDNAEKSWDIK